VATLANHALAGALGAWITGTLDGTAGFALGAGTVLSWPWLGGSLVPDKFDENEAKLARIPACSWRPR
jgi:hypothetical protein